MHAADSRRAPYPRGTSRPQWARVRRCSDTSVSGEVAAGQASTNASVKPTRGRP
ncbi:hypothetical protein CZ771_09010 [Actinomycetales bacterium JB111]|nr:hypothetical protein CZ771_09010 [Actinomycetales bacterium JB111]